MSWNPVCVVLLAACCTFVVFPVPLMAEEGAPEGAEGTASSPEEDEETVRLLRALELPATAARVRAAGVSEERVSGALDALRDARVGADVAADALELESVRAAESEEESAEGAVADAAAFGHFVRERIRAGVRGADLAAEIREERERRGLPPRGGAGMGRRGGEGGPHFGAQDDRMRRGGPARDGTGRADGAGPPDDAGRPDGADPADDAGRPEGVGRPEDAGRPDDAGQPDRGAEREERPVRARPAADGPRREVRPRPGRHQRGEEGRPAPRTRPGADR